MPILVSPCLSFSSPVPSFLVLSPLVSSFRVSCCLVQYTLVVFPLASSPLVLLPLVLSHLVSVARNTCLAQFLEHTLIVRSLVERARRQTRYAARMLLGLFEQR